MGTHSSNKDHFAPVKASTRSLDPGLSLGRAITTAARQVGPHAVLQSNFAKNRRRVSTKALRKAETLRRFNRLKKHHTASRAAQIVGTSLPTLWRWQQKYKKRGLAGLAPQNSKSGRRSPFTKLKLSDRAIRQLESLIVEHSCRRTAWQHFAKLCPLCPPLVAAYVQRTGRAPESLAKIGCLSQIQARVFVSNDQRRLYVKLPTNGILTTKLIVPQSFEVGRLKK